MIHFYDELFLELCATFLYFLHVCMFYGALNSKTYENLWDERVSVCLCT